jgi:hypothetical protein
MQKSVNEHFRACGYCYSTGVCPTCNGFRIVYFYDAIADDTYRDICDDCEGTGVCAACAPAEFFPPTNKPDDRHNAEA